MSCHNGKGEELEGGGSQGHSGPSLGKATALTDTWVQKRVLLVLNFLTNEVRLLQCHVTWVGPYPTAQPKGLLPLPSVFYMLLQEV